MKYVKAVLIVLLGFMLMLPVFAQGASENSAGNAKGTEQTLDVYSIMPEKYATTVFEAFTKDTGIKVNFVRLSSGEALSRIIAEKDNPQVDCLWGGPSDTYDAGVQEGVFLQYKPAEADKIPANYRSSDGYWTGIGVIPLTFLFNNSFLEKHNLKAPSSWYDLLDPAYAKQLQMADARTSGTATERIYSLVQAFGEDEAFAYQKKLNANIQLYTKSGAGGAMPTATGQAAGGVFYLVDALDIVNQGYPVTLTYPKEGVTYGVEGSGILTGCKHLEAAKKLMDWASTQKLGDVMMANNICYLPTRPDVKVTNPALDLSKVKLLEASSVWKGENRARLVDRFVKEIIQQ
ncbi:MAG: ABC transporter substrate-binding protein [Bacteroidales bacterium]|jgi:iron(III) transport system substrate-binding protein|nr:ABC transporter substrate-binding protein [Bacteroidales bacterium]